MELACYNDIIEIVLGRKCVACQGRSKPQLTAVSSYKEGLMLC